VVLLLESPHLSRLRSLQLPFVEFTADARRRFERLSVLRQIRALRFPTNSNIRRESPGEWFSDGGAAAANQWQELQSLTLPYYLDIGLLRRFSETAFWNRLNALTLVLPYAANEALSTLRDRLPASLRELRLSVNHTRIDLPGGNAFFARLAEFPLQSLHHHLVPLSAAALEGLLASTSRCRLRELSLVTCGLSEAHARILQGAAKVRDLWSLNLSVNQHFGDAAAQTRFSTEEMNSLVYLNVSNTPLGATGASALASARGWDRLRALDLSGTGLTTPALRRLLDSPNLQHLTRARLDDGVFGKASLKITPDIATRIVRLPHLAQLSLTLRRCDSRSKRILSGSESLAWLSLSCEDDPPARYDPSFFALDHYLPLDEADRVVLGGGSGNVGNESGGAPV
jgi:hypothetical protein